MREMTISTENYPALILLSEIELQCSLIARASSFLEESAQHWIMVGKGIDDGKKAPPIDIIAQCHICLSAAALIYKYLFPGRIKRKNPRISKRCAKLMQFLGEPELPMIRSVQVRNSWEHIDERLDDFLSARRVQSLAPIHVSTMPLQKETFVLRHFDPLLMQIKYGAGRAIDLRALVAEATELSTLIKEAIQKLHGESMTIY